VTGASAERASGEVYGEPLGCSLGEVMRVSETKVLRYLGKEGMLLSA
jgi:hypothetical protein